MTVFKCFFKIVKEYKAIILIYTLFLVFFGVFSLQTSESTTQFVANQPDVYIINKDTENEITNHLCDYIKKNANEKPLENNQDNIQDALFYRDINMIITIPENYGSDFLAGKNPSISIQKTGDYQSEYMEMVLNRYFKTAKIYQEQGLTNQDMLAKINETMDETVEVEITSKLDTNSLAKATFFYNFASYSILAGCVYVICVVMATFQEKKIKKRTNVSGIHYRSYNRSLLLGNAVFAFALWLFYVIISFVLMKDAMLSIYGLLYILNSFCFTICSLTIAFLIGNIVSDKNAINGIVNVIALGSSFLCGAFVPVQWLPESVLKVAHVLPTFWYIQTNETIATLETINWETIQPLAVNTGILLLFACGFMILTNLVSRNKRKEK